LSLGLTVLVPGDGEGGGSGEKERTLTMNEMKEIVGYYAEDGSIYCVECINKNKDLMRAIDKAITADDSEVNVYVCDGCKEEIK